MYVISSPSPATENIWLSFLEPCLLLLMAEAANHTYQKRRVLGFKIKAQLTHDFFFLSFLFLPFFISRHQNKNINIYIFYGEIICSRKDKMKVFVLFYFFHFYRIYVVINSVKI